MGPFSFLESHYMPTYDLRNKETGEVKEFLISISKKEEMVESGEWEQVHLGVADLISHHGSVLGKTSGDWKNKLDQIKKTSGGNTGLSPEKKRKYGFVDNSIHN
jgi:hypothetical protein